MGAGAASQQPVLSEQAALVMTLLDALPYVQLDLMEEWLPLAAELVNMVPYSELSDIVRDRFWEVMSNGEMDLERSAVCLAWWTTRGGREVVLGGHTVFRQGALHERRNSRREQALRLFDASSSVVVHFWPASDGSRHLRMIWMRKPSVGGRVDRLGKSEREPESEQNNKPNCPGARQVSNAGLLEGCKLLTRHDGGELVSKGRVNKRDRGL